MFSAKTSRTRSIIHYIAKSFLYLWYSMGTSAGTTGGGTSTPHPFHLPGGAVEIGHHLVHLCSTILHRTSRTFVKLGFLRSVFFEQLPQTALSVDYVSFTCVCTGQSEALGSTTCLWYYGGETTELQWVRRTNRWMRIRESRRRYSFRALPQCFNLVAHIFISFTLSFPRGFFEPQLETCLGCLHKF